MTGPSPRIRRDGMPFGLLGALALISACEWTIVRHKLDAMGASLWQYEAARVDMAKNVKGAKVLCFGDSLVKHGVSPKVLEARAGLPGYNLAIPGSPAPSSYILFRRAIEAGARPEAAVVDFMPCLMDTDPWPNITNWPYIATYADTLEMAWQAGDPNLFASIALRKTIPSVGCRESLRDNIVLAFKGMGELNRLGILVGLRSWEANRGFAMGPYRFDPRIPIEILAKPLFSDARISPLNQHYIDKFMKLADDNNVKVFWVLPPYMPVLQAYVDRNGYDAKHGEIVRSMMRRYPGLTVVDGRRSGFSPGGFIDTHHLAFNGAHNYTEELAVVLRDRLDHPEPGSKWYNLPPFRERPLTVRHEVIEETQAIVLQDIMKARR